MTSAPARFALIVPRPTLPRYPLDIEERAAREGAPMEEEWYADRANLRDLMGRHPDWSVVRLAGEIGRSASWVKKWRRRLAQAPPHDAAVLRGCSRARRHPPPKTAPAVVERLLAIRDRPPANLQRVPGPRAIRAFLEQDADLRAAGLAFPRSTATIWQILTRHGRIARHPSRAHEPLVPPPPLTSWQIDFKDVSTVPADPEGKRQHVVEALNCVDCGTSLLVDADVRGDFTEETALEAVVALLEAHGLPEAISLDRDPRFVGSAGARDFPSPLVRLLTCLGVAVTICPPRRPDRNCYVERYNGTYERECLRVHQPTTLEDAREVTAAFRQHYNHERPNQARTCQNRPPLVAFPALPPRPAVPAQVDPDRWLTEIDGRHYVRTVGEDGTVHVETHRYYVGRRLARRRVVLTVAAKERVLVVRHRQEVVKRLPLRGLHGEVLAFPAYAELMRGEARAARRRRRASRVAAA
jgi:hypothetical protein